MAVSTIKLDELEKYVDNVYEAIVIIAKRAKQINEEQKRTIESEVGFEEETDVYNDDEEDESVKDKDLEPQFVKLPKPTKLALDEMMAGKIKFEYLDKEEES